MTSNCAGQTAEQMTNIRAKLDVAAARGPGQEAAKSVKQAAERMVTALCTFCTDATGWMVLIEAQCQVAYLNVEHEPKLLGSTLTHGGCKL